MPSESSQDSSTRICYLYTTFPLVSETFLQREMRVIRTKTSALELHSIWGGKTSFEGLKVQRFYLWELIKLFYWLPYWIVKKPAVIGWFFSGLIVHPPRYGKNWAENLLGFAFALIRVRAIEAWNPQLIHAVWATMPATAALTINKLTGIPFSMGAHAYDIFQKGGDCFLKNKIAEARFIHTSTKFAKSYLLSLGANSQKVHLIRRGLSVSPPANQMREQIDVIHFLTIGRLVEKKGYMEQLRIYRDLRKRSIPFTVEIVGDGPLLKQLSRLIRDYQLESQVKLIGKVPHEEIQAYYERADFFIFTGIVAKNGDRNGLANVIPEAMARGIPVITTPDSGIVENFKPDCEAAILPIRPIEAWVVKIKELAADYEQRKALVDNARAWVDKRFSAQKNSARLFKLIEAECLLTRILTTETESDPLDADDEDEEL